MRKLTDQYIIERASELGIDPALLLAVDKKESRGSGFILSEGRYQGELKVLFERHHFSRLTGRRFDKSHPSVSSRVRGGYLPEQSEFGRYMSAMRLDASAAMMSSSWGRYQIMGFNFRTCGYDRVQSMVIDFYRGEDRQFDGFIKFLQDTRVAGVTLFNHLRNKNWESFARGYNGPRFKENNYDTDLQKLYNSEKRRLNRIQNG
jgi:hypothetical protein